MLKTLFCKQNRTKQKTTKTKNPSKEETSYHSEVESGNNDLARACNCNPLLPHTYAHKYILLNYLFYQNSPYHQISGESKRVEITLSLIHI